VPAYPAVMLISPTSQTGFGFRQLVVVEPGKVHLKGRTPADFIMGRSVAQQD